MFLNVLNRHPPSAKWHPSKARRRATNKKIKVWIPLRTYILEVNFWICINYALNLLDKQTKKRLSPSKLIEQSMNKKEDLGESHLPLKLVASNIWIMKKNKKIRA